MSIAREDWLPLFDLAEEKGEHVRLGGKSEEPASNVHDGRAAAAPLALALSWAMMFSYRFFKSKHMGLLELESLISILRRATPEGKYRHGGPWFLSIRVVFGSRLEKTMELTKIHPSCFENWVSGALRMTSHSSWSGCPLGRIRSIESWYASLPKLPPPPTAVFASDHALSELDLLLEPLSGCGPCGGRTCSQA